MQVRKLFFTLFHKEKKSCSSHKHTLASFLDTVFSLSTYPSKIQNFPHHPKLYINKTKPTICDIAKDIAQVLICMDALSRKYVLFRRIHLSPSTVPFKGNPCAG